MTDPEVTDWESLYFESNKRIIVLTDALKAERERHEATNSDLKRAEGEVRAAKWAAEDSGKIHQAHEDALTRKVNYLEEKIADAPHGPLCIQKTYRDANCDCWKAKP